MPSHASLDPNARSIEMIRSHAENQVVDVVCMAGGLPADPSSMDVCDDGASEAAALRMASEKAEVFIKLNEQRKAAIDMWLQQIDEACEAAIKAANFIHEEPYPQAAYNAAYINAHAKMEQLYPRSSARVATTSPSRRSTNARPCTARSWHSST